MRSNTFDTHLFETSSYMYPLPTTPPVYRLSAVEGGRWYFSGPLAERLEVIVSDDLWWHPGARSTKKLSEF